jgi:hypothetical protein
LDSASACKFAASINDGQFKSGVVDSGIGVAPWRKMIHEQNMNLKIS